MKAISRFLVVIFVALIAVPALAVTQTITTAVQLLATTVLMMGGTGTPLADTTDPENQIYMSTMLNGFFVKPDYTRIAVYTPEEFRPSTGNDDLTFDDSVAEGVENIHAEIVKPEYYANDGKVVVFGYSQSAVIIAFEKQNLANDPLAPDPEDLEFVVVGSLSNPDGGLFTRLPGFVIPDLGVTFEPPMPNDDYLTTSYVREYEGLADLPDNPLNLLALGNALVGAALLHPDYRSVDPEAADQHRVAHHRSQECLRPGANAKAADPDGPRRGCARTDPRGPRPRPALGRRPRLRPDHARQCANALHPASDLQPGHRGERTAQGDRRRHRRRGERGERSACGSCAIEIEAAAIEFHAGATEREACAPTRPRPLQILRESLKFGPENRPSTTRSSGGGPLKRIVNVLTGLRPKSGATDESADAPKPEQQQDNQDDEAA